MNYCCQIRLSGPQDVEQDAGMTIAPFLAVRRNHTAPSRPLVYLSQHHDTALVDCLALRGWDVSRAKTVADALNLVKANRPHAGIVDFGSFASADVASFEALLRDPRVGWVALADGERLCDIAIARLIRHCCFDYVRNATAYTTIGYLVGHAYGMLKLADGDPAADAPPPGGTMIGACDAMRRLFSTIRKVANTDASVFIAGESGTGKELTAAAIHQHSSRAEAPFVAVNCAAIPSTLLQAELFGHERGAFTGAHQRKIGRIEAAHGGTLFLDEIGDMPFESQASLLRFLQEGTIERLGGHASIPVEVRIVSATHVDLEAAMRAGRFRADLYYRLCVLRIDEPPLRVRGRDIMLLADHVLRRYHADSPHRIRGFMPCAVEAIHNYAWPGNVRELINRVRFAIVMTNGPMISATDLELHAYTSRRPPTLAEVRRQAERHAIEETLLRHRHQHADVASELGISRATLYRLMTAHGLHG
ncbi:sigma-54 dependent transcriptional regulator [Burkholderia stabilis]|uniref:Sigma-54 factor interaction domain-containing protein n=1 Tax=Burkholderia stabilis TaxID=95485 RepID=A0AAJ5NA79_9BURK|nr:Transcriptional regulatory protein ZraR,acetoacetate metabolism regulatory protein AtoC,Transcriptional regulator containing PAS, AAA-type ATPase, and DNA-binding domains,PEP-CTERM-box response regulator transcription factor,Sigma-54 interaction domain [Burkholderia stabilis]HDR9494483.1 sigma-54-dependent Fis family transcriptional regulator [Burkholderia stabilis]HDR9524199.1 sigma-54-dependent Fis family transcriptional regulator [Burkholderia stabilis]HDR9532316.1 sigma-54-dependent Fis f